MGSSAWRFFLFLGIEILSETLGYTQERQTDGMTLEAVLQQARKSNLEIQQARESTKAAQERSAQQPFFPDPEVGLAFWETPSHFANIGKAGERWLSLSQTIPLWGKQALRQGLAQGDVRIADLEAQDTARKVLSNAIRIYYDLVFAQQTLAIHHAQANLVEKIAQSVRQRLEVGQATQQDLLRVQGEWLEHANTAVVMEREIPLHIARLNILLNRPTATPIETPPLSAAPEPVGSLEDLLRKAETSSPANALADALIGQSNAQVDFSRREFLPDLMAEVAYVDVAQGQNQWMTSLKMAIPWVHRGRYEARIREEESNAARARLARQAVFNETHLAVQDLFIQLQNHLRLIRLQQEGLLPLARQVVESARIGYETQKNDLAALMEAQRQLKELEMRHVRALADAHAVVAELKNRTGLDAPGGGHE